MTRLQAYARLLVHALMLVDRGTRDPGRILIRVWGLLLLLLVTFIGGRVMPFFTEKAVPGAKARQDVALERLVYGFMLALMVVDLFFEAQWLSGALAAGAAATQAMRLKGWYAKGIWSIPILWVLYTAYGWMIAGLALRTASVAGVLPHSVALHALTMGAIGLITLGMMARVSLGHTGRDLRSAMPVNIAFVLLNLGTAIRVAGSR